MVLGKDFQVITISFDQREGTDLAVKKRDNYLKLITKEVNTEGWKFYTGDSANIMKVTNATGFKFKKAGNDFLHSATIIMISPNRKITRYLQEPTSCRSNLRWQWLKHRREKADQLFSGYFSFAIRMILPASNMC